jgi:hypothetical protein
MNQEAVRVTKDTTASYFVLKIFKSDKSRFCSVYYFL